MTLLKTTDVYRVENEDQAIAMINDCRDAAAEQGFTLSKSSYVIKTKKSKGEIIDSWCLVSLEKTFSE